MPFCVQALVVRHSPVTALNRILLIHLILMKTMLQDHNILDLSFVWLQEFYKSLNPSLPDAEIRRLAGQFRIDGQEFLELSEEDLREEFGRYGSTFCNHVQSSKYGRVSNMYSNSLHLQALSWLITIKHNRLQYLGWMPCPVKPLSSSCGVAAILHVKLNESDHHWKHRRP